MHPVLEEAVQPLQRESHVSHIEPLSKVFVGHEQVPVFGGSPDVQAVQSPLFGEVQVVQR